MGVQSESRKYIVNVKRDGGRRVEDEGTSFGVREERGEASLVERAGAEGSKMKTSIKEHTKKGEIDL